MSRWWFAGLVVTGLTLAPLASGEETSNITGLMTGNALLATCQGPGFIQKGTCIGYVEGVYDYLAVILNYLGKKQCRPEKGQVLRGRQLMDIVINYLREHPEQRDLSAAWLVTYAIGSAWHCDLPLPPANVVARPSLSGPR